MSGCDLVCVFESGDQSLLPIVKSVLDDAGIPYIAEGEGLQNLFAMGSLGTGFNPVTGPVRILVCAENEEAARSLLSEMEEDPGDE